MDPTSSSGAKRRRSPPARRSSPSLAQSGGNGGIGNGNGIGSSTGPGRIPTPLSTSTTNTSNMTHLNSGKPSTPDETPNDSAPFGMGIGNGAYPPSTTPGGYAYSTTLRRQVSGEFGRGRSISPVAFHHGHGHASGRGRSASIRGDGILEEEPGIFERVLGSVRRVMGREGYEALPSHSHAAGHGYGPTPGSASAAETLEGRGQETPSAIYAHKTIDVSPPERSQLYCWSLRRQDFIDTPSLCFKEVMLTV